jgi:hypothetical protein
LPSRPPTPRGFARHINIKYHYIRTILPFKDFILAYVTTKWNIADLNTKPCVVEIFRRVTTLMLDGLHDLEWRKEVNKTLKEIWQAVEARDGQRELTGRQLQREEERVLARKKDLQAKTTPRTEQQQRASSATKRYMLQLRVPHGLCDRTNSST